MCRFHHIVRTLAAVGFLLASAHGATVYSITNLGNLGGPDITATGINSLGQVTGFGTDAQGNVHGFFWSGGTLTDLGLYASNYQSQAMGVNSSGQIAGTQTGAAGTQAGTWLGGAYAVIGGAGTYANAINDFGQVAGMFTSAGGQGHAFVSTNGALTDLGTIGGGAWSSAYGINRNGTAVGYGQTASGSFQAFVSSANGTTAQLSTSPGGNSYAMAINNSGVVAGLATNRTGYLHATEWNGNAPGAAAIDLGTLGGSMSAAYGINTSGIVVGYSTLANSADTHAFVFSAGRMTDLNTAATAAAGWQLLNAYGINDKGQIVGSGTLNGVAEAFLLTPQAQVLGFTLSTGNSVPEPDSILFAALGLILIAAYRMVHKRVEVPVKKTSLPIFQLK